MKQRGFTLIELLVVIAIISLLSSVVLASLTSARNKGKDSGAKAQMKSIQSEAALFYSDNGTYSGMWNAGLPADMWNKAIAFEDDTLTRGAGATGDYYYVALLLKNNNMLCLDANNMKEISSVGWVWPTGNFVCPP